MCVLVVKPAGIAFPTMDTMENCFKNNSDGAGYMFPNEAGKVTIRKGFMQWQSFKHEYEKILKMDKVEKSYIFHFRIGTHGPKKTPELCHPFPVSKNIQFLKMSACQAPFGFAHNGILSYLPTYTDISDTMVYVADILAPALLACRNVKAIESIIHATIDGSRFALMEGNGDIHRYGDFIEDAGVYYSNSSFQYYSKPVKIWRYPNGYNYLDNDDGFDYEAWKRNIKKENDDYPELL